MDDKKETCLDCQEVLGKYAKSPQFNCHKCWDIIQKENSNLKDLVREATDLLIMADYMGDPQIKEWLEQAKLLLERGGE